ncbi:type I-B CRISPR-associated protein Cas7/Csh2 [Oceanithermus sp.]
MKVLDGEILFLYDAKMANPNGDPDEENKPRMDYATSRALVSDVRLKRYLRDYWLDKGIDVWVRTIDGGTVTADQRLKALADAYEKETGQAVDVRKAVPAEFINWLLGRLIDVRLFGATMPIKGDTAGQGGGLTFTGPVQFSWGFTLHPAEIVESATISSTFAGRESDFGTFGKDWRLHYGLIAFMGRVSAARAEATNLDEEDLDALEDALLRAIPAEATTRSKFGQTPRLYLHVRYKQGRYPFPPVGDFRDLVNFQPQKGLPARKVRSVEDYTLDLGPLAKTLSRYPEEIEEVRYWIHPDLQADGLDSLPGLQKVQ